MRRAQVVGRSGGEGRKLLNSGKKMFKEKYHMENSDFSYALVQSELGLRES